MNERGATPRICRNCNDLVDSWRGRFDNAQVTLRMCAAEGGGFKRYATWPEPVYLRSFVAAVVAVVAVVAIVAVVAVVAAVADVVSLLFDKNETWKSRLAYK